MADGRPMADSGAPGRARTRFADIVVQSALAVVGRRMRSMLTAAGIGLGVAATVATIGVTASAGAAISDRFDAVRATEVTIRYSDGVPRPAPSVVSRARRLHGVVETGLICQAKQEVRASRLAAGLAEGTGRRVNLIAAQPAALRALGVTPTVGRLFDDGHGARGDAVAVLDTSAARALGVDVAANPLVWLGDRPVMVIGAYDAPAGEARLTSAIVLPYEPCVEPVTAGGYLPPDVVIRTQLGAADQVAQEARLALLPERPDALEALVPPDLRTFRQGVEGDTRALFLGLAVVSLIIGALGVSNTTLVSVMERRPEIGLRRAIGASRRAIAGQFLLESALLGLGGGLLGAVVGIDVTAFVALARDWLVVVDPGLIALGPAIGIVVGILAGVYPAYAATRVTPTRSLRAG